MKRRAGAASRCSTKRGSERDSTTPKPTGSIDQPMMSSVPGQVCSAAAPICKRRIAGARRAARPRRRRRRTARTRSRRLWLLRSLRNASVHNSTTTTSTTSPGSARASRAPSDKSRHAAGATEAEHRHPHGPRPKAHFARPTRASRLGVAMPVDDTVTTTSTSRAAMPARSSARLRGLHEQLAGAVEIGLRALAPVVRGIEPFQRPHRIAPLDAGIDENVGELRIAREAASRRSGARDRRPPTVRADAAAPPSPAPATSPASMPCSCPLISSKIAHI